MSDMTHVMKNVILFIAWFRSGLIAAFCT